MRKNNGIFTYFVRKAKAKDNKMFSQLFRLSEESCGSFVKDTYLRTPDFEAHNVVVNVALVSVAGKYGIIVNSFPWQTDVENYFGSCKGTIFMDTRFSPDPAHKNQGKNSNPEASIPSK